MPYSASALSASREWHHQKCSKKSCLLTGCLRPEGVAHAGNSKMRQGSERVTQCRAAQALLQNTDNGCCSPVKTDSLPHIHEVW